MNSSARIIAMQMAPLKQEGTLLSEKTKAQGNCSSETFRLVKLYAACTSPKRSHLLEFFPAACCEAVNLVSHFKKIYYKVPICCFAGFFKIQFYYIFQSPPPPKQLPAGGSVFIATNSNRAEEAIHLKKKINKFMQKCLEFIVSKKEIMVGKCIWYANLHL